MERRIEKLFSSSACFMFAIKDEFVTKFGKKERTRERKKDQPCRRKFTVTYVRTRKINDTRRTTVILVEDRLDSYCCSGGGGDFLLLFIKKRTKEIMLLKEEERKDAKV